MNSYFMLFINLIPLSARYIVFRVVQRLCFEFDGLGFRFVFGCSKRDRVASGANWRNKLVGPPAEHKLKRRVVYRQKLKRS